MQLAALKNGENAETLPHVRNSTQIERGSKNLSAGNLGIILPGGQPPYANYNSAGGMNSSFSSGLGVGSAGNRKKLPFGFHVQNQKRDLLRLESRGKTSGRPVSNRAVISELARPDSSGHDDRRKNMNNTAYDIM